jgi:PAS domain S-box-containing protein
MKPEGQGKGTSPEKGLPQTFRPGRIFSMEPLKICLIYLVFGIIWILFSDWILFRLIPQAKEYAEIQSVKGVVFILVTTFLLFLLIENFTRRLWKKNEELRTANDQLTVREDELRAQRDALAQSQAEWETTFNAISDWISLISPDGRIYRTNKSVTSLFGIPPDQVIGRNCFEIVHGTACPIEDCPRLRMQKSGKRESIEIPKRDGKGWILITVDPVFNSVGEVVRAVHIVSDISGRIREQKSLDQAKTKLHLLNHIMFSEIQNMIYTLWGFQQIARDMITDASVRSVIGKEEVILNKISLSLKFAQTYQNLGLKPPKWQDVHQVFLLAISHLDIRNLKYSARLDRLEIFADPLLEQVIQILADNTIIHGKTATQVTLRYREGPESVTLFFEDDGVGIPDNLKENIFAPDFHRTQAVGLFLVREILEITGISIRETGIPGKGACFELVVPKEMYRFTGRA